MTRYIEAFSWPKDIQEFLDTVVTERPLLNVCSGATKWGNVTMDYYELADINGDWKELPFATDAFAAVFADPPWNGAYKKDVAQFVREALRVAPIAYLMAPWIYGGKIAPLVACWVRQQPGINDAVVLTKYRRAGGSRYLL